MLLAYIWEISDGACRARIQGTMQDVTLQLSDQQNRQRRLAIADWVEFPEDSRIFKMATCPDAIVSGERQIFDLEMIPHYTNGYPKREEDIVVGARTSIGGNPTAVILRPSTKQLFRVSRRDGDALAIWGHELVAYVSFCSRLPQKDAVRSLSAPR